MHSNFNKVVPAYAYDRALRSHIAMLTGQKPKDRRRWKRNLRTLEAQVSA